MMKYFLLLPVFLTSATIVFSLQSVALANNAQSNIVTICEDAKKNGKGDVPSFCTDYGNATTTSNPVADTLVKVASAIAFLTGIVAVIMIMYAGFELITSSGDSQKITRARQIITYAVIGLVVIISARLIVSFAIAVLIK